MPRIPDDIFPRRHKQSPFDERIKLGWVLDALIQETENPRTAETTLPRTAENRLNKLFRHEIISTLEKIRRENGAPFLVDTTPYLKMTETWKSGDEVLSKRTLSAEEIPIKLTILEGFENWRTAFLHRQKIKLSDLTPENRQKIREVVSDVDERFQLNSSPTTKLEWSPGDPTRDHNARKDALDFLKAKGVVLRYDFYYSNIGIGSSIQVEIDIEQFQLFKAELLKLPESQFDADTPEPKPIPPAQKKDTSKPFQHLKWDTLTIQFIDGHHVKISGQDTKTTVTAYFKEMGFEDARKRQPNKQWLLLKLLAESNGGLSWEKSEAKGDIKKKKQLLAKTLRDYFGIKDDPFYPYKENDSYRIKINLIPESASR